jgi:hypothetical protein
MMAVLNEQQRVDVWAEIMRQLSSAHESCGITKPQLRAAIDAVDQWCEDNAAAFNAALPVAARNGLTAAQKARLLAYVALKRHGG